MEDLDNLKATELTLGLPGTSDAPEKPATISSRVNKRTNEECCTFARNRSEDTAAPAAKTRAVGWPPVRSYRMNSSRARKLETEDNSAIYVKVSMDGAPYLRKVDLRIYNGYKELRNALDDRFRCFSSGGVEAHIGESDNAITYEDRDGDWMLVGDVPWEMFISSCKRLRIMKGSEARGQ
ncbi:hypothetical protein C4D60_Mb04t05080 [Musa balbisiana]|uniref:Auxin-responsive protein n=1 Tax=Musa balbisiana TaxID=52838 RepID=A0A4S8K9V2_MUSBA|nr:hypothetical protein C4D60_Mb04t05080 [Musa balbisiana]